MLEDACLHLPPNPALLDPERLLPLVKPLGALTFELTYNYEGFQTAGLGAQGRFRCSLLVRRDRGQHSLADHQRREGGFEGPEDIEGLKLHMEVHGGELSVRSVNDEMSRVTSSSISQHKQTKESEMPRDFIDFYLNKFDETTGIYFSSSPAFCSTSTSATLTSTSSPSLASCISAQSKKSSSQQEIEVGFPTCHWKFQ